LATVTPWLLYFAVAPMMHERYLLWAAGTAAILIGVSIGTTLLGVFLSLVSCAMSMSQMLEMGNAQNFCSNVSPNFGLNLGNCLGRLYPDIGWTVVLCAAIFLYSSVVRVYRRSSSLARSTLTSHPELA